MGLKDDCMSLNTSHLLKSHCLLSLPMCKINRSCSGIYLSHIAPWAPGEMSVSQARKLEEHDLAPGLPPRCLDC